VQTSLLNALPVLLAGLSASPCAAQNNTPDESEVQAVLERFAPIQMLSFAAGFEYCGYLVRTPQSALAFTEIVRGGADGCTPLAPPTDVMLIASIHTHGAYDPLVPAEFPTVMDIDSDHREGVNGYIATPGGRLWYVDSSALTVHQLCNSGCLPQDPEFQPGDDGIIALTYTRQELLELEQAQ
jgi:Domain of unknown function (DUF4329)